MQFKIPATSANLGPGFDTLGIAISLKNEITISRSKIPTIQVRGEGSRNPKLRVDNIFVKIFNDIYFELTKSADNFKFVFENKIPISRGLGSSSAVIIGALFAAHKIAKVDITKEELLNIAIRYETHPDNITPALYGGFNLSMVNYNGSVTSRKKCMPDSVVAVMVIPNRSTSTNYSRAALPKKYSTKDLVFNLSRTSMLSYAFFNEEWDLLREASLDRVHQMYRMRAIPELFEVQKRALENGALMSTLSGSGSSFFNLCKRDDSLELKNRLISLFPKFRVEIFDFDNEGAEFIE